MKFFNIDPEGTLGTTTAEPSIAELMAKQGRMTTDGYSEDNDLVNHNGEENTATTANDAQNVATTTENPQTEIASEPTPTQATEATVATPEVPTETTQPISLQEVLSQHQPTEVLKTLGYDDSLISFASKYKNLDPKMMAFLEHWQSNGEVKTYLEAMNTNFKEMPAEDVMKHQLRKEYPKASEQQLNILYQKKIVSTYGIDSIDEEEAETGKLLLQAEADKYRDTLVAEQDKFLLPTPPTVSEEPDETVKQFEEYKASVESDPFTKNIFAANSISFGEGEDKFNFPVNPSELTEMLFVPEKWQQTLFTEQNTPQGKKAVPNVEHQLLVAAVAKYGKSFLNEYAKHFKSLGGKAAIAPIVNANEPQNSTPSASQTQPQTAAEAMAKMGRWSN